MAIRSGIGIARDHSATVAGKLAAERALLENPTPEVAILFVSSFYDADEVSKAVRTVLKRTPVFGSSSYQEVSNAGTSRNSIVVLLLSSPEIDFSVHSTRVNDDAERAGRYLMAGYLREGYDPQWEQLTALMVATETDYQGGPEYLRGLNSQMPHPLALNGGNSSSIEKFSGDYQVAHGFQFNNRLVSTDALNLLFLKTAKNSKIAFSYGYESDWTPIAAPVICTKTEKNRVFEVNGTPVLEYIQKTLGLDPQKISNELTSRFVFIAGLRDGEITRWVVRYPGYDLENPSVVFYPTEDMQDMEIQLVYLSQKELLEGAHQAALRAKKALGDKKPAVVFLFSCHTRHRLLHSRVGEEVAAVRDNFPSDVPIIGFYCAGEYAPVYNEYDEIVDPTRKLAGSRQFSNSISIMCIGSEDIQSRIETVDQRERLKAFLQEDDLRAARRPGELKENYQKLLKGAETIIIETEQAFKTINRHHMSLAEEFRKQNIELEESRRRNEELQKLLRQYTAQAVWRKAELSVEAGVNSIPDEELWCTLMFMDVKGFTAFAEKHTSEEVISAINVIFDPATRMILDRGGDIDKFIGDCIFAVFEFPEDAFLAAVDVQQLMITMAEKMPFSIRCGINSGRVISGNVGGRSRCDNTLIGDAVNLSQRLESACTPGAILLSEGTFFELDEDLVAGMKQTRRTIQVKGKSDVINVVEITPTKSGE